MHRFIFLDCDGVLNNHKTFLRVRQEQVKPMDRVFPIDPDCMARLNHLTTVTGAMIVLSSTWRLSPGSIIHLKNHGLIGNIVGVTPRSRSEVRGQEIQQWLDHNAVKPFSFVILDDDSDMEHLLPRLIKTTPEFGLEDIHVERAKSLLFEDSDEQ